MNKNIRWKILTSLGVFVIFFVVGVYPLLAQHYHMPLPGWLAAKQLKLGLDLKGGVQLVYHAEPTAAQPVVDADAMQRSIDLMQQRVNAFGVSEAELFQSGADQIEVNLPGVTDAESAAQQVGSTAQLFFYDWEANILDDKCKTNPDQNANQRQAINGLRTAVTQAAKARTFLSNFDPKSKALEDYTEAARQLLRHLSGKTVPQGA